MNPNKPEEGHSTIDNGNPNITVSCSKQGLKHFNYSLCKTNTSKSPNSNINTISNDYCDSKRDNICKCLRDVWWHFFWHSNSNILFQTEIIDNHGNKGCYKGC